MGETDTYDRYDRAVLNHIQPGQVIKGYQLRDLYRNETEINKRSTAKRRARQLTSTDAFESVAGFGNFRYIGGKQ